MLCILLVFFSTAIGIRCKDGIVFGVEKLVLSKLYEEGSNKRIFNIDRHVGMVRILATHTVRIDCRCVNVYCMCVLYHMDELIEC